MQCGSEVFSKQSDGGSSSFMIGQVGTNPHMSQHTGPSGVGPDVPRSSSGNDESGGIQVSHNFPNQQFGSNTLSAQIASLIQQIADSEANLRAQFESVSVRREAQLAAEIEENEKKKIASICEQVSLNVEPLSKLLDQLNGHCSKDVISNSKRWIFEHCTTDQLREAILMYLLYRVKEARATEQFKLHILYLINDWAHHCQRKKLDAIRQMLSRYVPQLYAFTAQGAKEPSVNEKLEKLVGVWEGHKYFDDGCYKQLRNPLLIYQNWKNAQQAEYSKKSAEIHAQLLAAYRGYEQQHLEFSMHCRNQIAIFQQQIEGNSLTPGSTPTQTSNQPPMNRRERRSRFDQKAPSNSGQQDFPQAPPDNDYGRFFAAPPACSSKCPSPRDIYHARPDEPDEAPFVYYDKESVEDDFKPPTNNPQRPAASFRGTIPAPNLQCAPPVFDEAALIPKVPYYNLPAGVMMPLIAMEDVLYKTVPVSQLRLPPPMPPPERLMRAIDVFYMPPSAENPRDSDGWELLGLFEYFAKKNEIKKKIEDELKLEGKTIEDMIENIRNDENDDKDEKKNQETNRRSSSSSSSKSSDSRTYSKRRRNSRRSLSSASSRSSLSHSRKGKSRSNSSSRSSSPKKRPRSASRSASPEARPSFSSIIKRSGRTPTPPMQVMTPSEIPSAYGVAQSGSLPRLSSTNKGAQLLTKMGWQGGGLGVERQGIEEPISGGEVRDRIDQFRGVGSKPDMYEEYRKQMSGYHRSRRRFD